MSYTYTQEGLDRRRAPWTCPKCDKTMRVGGRGPHALYCGQGEAAFWARVTKAEGDGCWIYRGHKINTGHCDLMRAGKKILAHRYSWTLAQGPIPDGRHVLHRCNVQDCIRPVHLYLGTDVDNAADRVKAGTTMRGERNACNKLSEEQVQEIRRLFVRIDPMKSNMGELAKLYGVWPGTIRNIVLRLSWKHLQ